MKLKSQTLWVLKNFKRNKIIFFFINLQSLETMLIGFQLVDNAFSHYVSYNVFYSQIIK